MFGAMAVRKIADARGDANPVCLSGPDGMTGPYGGSGPAFMAVRIAGRTSGAKARVPDSIVGDRTAGTRRVGRSVAAVGASGRPESLPCAAGRMKARYSEF